MTVPAAVFAGKVVNGVGAGVAAVVEACPQPPGTTCFGQRTGKNGMFSIPVEVGHSYRLVARSQEDADRVTGSGSLPQLLMARQPSQFRNLVIPLRSFPVPAGTSIAGKRAASRLSQAATRHPSP